MFDIFDGGKANDTLMLMDMGRKAWNGMVFDIRIDRQKTVMREITMHLDEGDGISVAAEYSEYHGCYMVTLSLSQAIVMGVLEFIKANAIEYHRTPDRYEQMVAFWQGLWDGETYEYDR